MFQFFETIRVEGGVPMNLNYHQNRVIKTFIDHTSSKDLKRSYIPDLQFLLYDINPKYNNGTYKCKVQYNVHHHSAGSHQPLITFDKYEPRTVKLLKVVINDSIEYSYKQTDRSSLNTLLQQKQICDDILIIKNGLVTDTSYTNIAFFDGKIWVTPDSPLLEGTARSRLLEKGLVLKSRIKVNDLKEFRAFKLINSMLDDNLDRSEDIKGIVL